MRCVVLTGSRKAPEEWRVDVECALEQCYAAFGPFVLREGECGQGPDKWGREWAEANASRGVVLDGRPVQNWRSCRPVCRHLPASHRHRYKSGKGTFCAAAGDWRNEDMIDGGADVCLGARFRNSKGTGHCMSYAESLGVPVSAWPFDGLNDLLLMITRQEGAAS